MLLSDKTIMEYINAGRIRIAPRPDLSIALGSCSLDLRWSGQLERMGPGEWVSYEIPEGGLMVFNPGDFALASTMERVRLPDTIAGRLEGRSSFARRGRALQYTAGLLDPGWEGVITLELSNVGKQPITLTHGMRICAMAFEFVDKPVAVPYRNKPNNKYAGAIAPELSKFHEEER
jgi:dCTP deaminase